VIRTSCKLYRCFDAAGRLLYDGVSVYGLARLAGHQRAPWIDEVTVVKIETFSSTCVALGAERRAIRLERPLHNLLRPKDTLPREQASEPVDGSESRVHQVAA
jgi:hypothetical protein